MRRPNWLLLSLIMTMMASEALAIFDAELLYGRRWYEGENDNNFQGNQLTLAAHVDPIPLVPVAFGLALSQITLNEDDFQDVKSASITEIGLEIKAWVPLVPIVTPYARVNVPVSTTYTVEAEGGDIEGKMNGYHLGVGGQFSIIPLLSVVAEFQLSSQKLSDVEGKGALKDLEFEDADANSTAFLLGARLGI